MAEILARIIEIVFFVLQWAIIIRILFSWLPMAGIRIDSNNPIIRALYSITDPILDPLRKYTTIGMLDLSPIVAIFGLGIIRSILLTALGFPPRGGFLF